MPKVNTKEDIKAEVEEAILKAKLAGWTTLYDTLEASLTKMWNERGKADEQSIIKHFGQSPDLKTMKWAIRHLDIGDKE